jgi:hypothetical protein
MKLTRDKGSKRYNILRIRGPSTKRIGNWDIVPIQARGFDPILDGVGLKPKTMLHLTKGVEIKVVGRSILDLLLAN